MDIGLGAGPVALGLLTQELGVASAFTALGSATVVLVLLLRTGGGRGGAAPLG